MVPRQTWVAPKRCLSANLLDKHAASATRTADGASATGAGPEVAGRGLAGALAREALLDDVATGAGRVDGAAVLASLELGILSGEDGGGDAEGEEGNDGEELHFERVKICLVLSLVGLCL